VWANVLIAGASNGVNITDGLDGLAAGASVMVFTAYVGIGQWQYNQSCSVVPGPGCYDVGEGLDLAVVACAIAGACFGFLWWNASPASIIMGDTGSLSLGAALAGVAILTRTELLLVILGGLFVMITLSVVIQVASFKLTGRRVFRIAPIHHHFEMLGWAEITIVIRFLIIAGICVLSRLGLFYARVGHRPGGADPNGRARAGPCLTLLPVVPVGEPDDPEKDVSWCRAATPTAGTSLRSDRLTSSRPPPPRQHEHRRSP
jgi:phospho-N-acetylmuramoyl-pentapeptide-transferase